MGQRASGGEDAASTAGLETGATTRLSSSYPTHESKGDSWMGHRAGLREKATAGPSTRRRGDSLRMTVEETNSLRMTVEETTSLLMNSLTTFISGPNSHPRVGLLRMTVVLSCF